MTILLLNYNVVALESFISEGIRTNSVKRRKRIHWEDGWKGNQALTREEDNGGSKRLEKDVSNKFELAKR
jgi:hypothetical protein